MNYDDNKLASLAEMEQMARAYNKQSKLSVKPSWVKSHILASNFKNYDECCHYFNFAKYLTNFLITKTSSSNYRKQLNTVSELLFKNELIFDLFFENKEKPSENISFFGSYISAGKELMMTMISLSISLTPLMQEGQFTQSVTEMLTCVKTLIFLS